MELPCPLVSTDWLAENIDDPDLFIFDVSVYLEFVEGYGVGENSKIVIYNDEALSRPSTGLSVTPQPQFWADKAIMTENMDTSNLELCRFQTETRFRVDSELPLAGSKRRQQDTAGNHRPWRSGKSNHHLGLL